MKLLACLYPASVMMAMAQGAYAQDRDTYPWLAASGQRGAGTIAGRITPPAGFSRTAQAPGSFGRWLRHLPLKPAGAPVRLFDGRLKARQDVHAAVVDIDVGTSDLQQCADAVMRLRAEYLFSQNRGGDIHFNFTSGDRIDFSRWAAGWRPRVAGAKVRWRQSGAVAGGHGALRRYLRVIFTYAGSYSLSRELTPVDGREAVEVGDIFLRGGFPGHAVIVVDRADNRDTGKVAFLLAQSYMPAQDIHILRHPGGPHAPWYLAGDGERLVTPEWSFDWRARYRFEAAARPAGR